MTTITIERKPRHSNEWEPYRDVPAHDATFWLHAFETEEWNRYGHYAASFRIADDGCDGELAPASERTVPPIGAA